MDITLNTITLSDLIFADDDRLFESRRAYTRSIFSKLDPVFPRRVISAELADNLKAAPNFYVQVIEETPPIYVLWQAKDWLESDTKVRNLTVTMRKVKEEWTARTATDRRLWRMATKIAKAAGVPAQVMFANFQRMLSEGGEPYLKQVLLPLSQAVSTAEKSIVIYEEPEETQAPEVLSSNPQERSEVVPLTAGQEAEVGSEETPA